MNRKISNVVSGVVLVSIAGAFAFWVYFGDTSVRQTRRMRLAREFLPVITNAVYLCPQFRDVHVGVGTGAGGCFLVTGMVNAESQLSELDHAIAATKPPLVVLYRLKFLGWNSKTKTSEGSWGTTNWNSTYF